MIETLNMLYDSEPRRGDELSLSSQQCEVVNYAQT